MSFTNFPNGVSSMGMPLVGVGAQDVSGSVYFVDGNSGSDGNNGKSWEKAFKTLAVAFAASHANIASGASRWARRNTIFIAGDDFTEDLVAFPQKTDIIGVGSSDNYPMACIRGNHAPVNGAMGTRFYNVRFRPAASGDLVTLASTSGGQVEFHGCLFDAHYAAFVAPSAIDTTACPYVKIIGCEFIGEFSGDVIDIGAGAASNMVIRGNVITGGADNGIVCTGTPTIVQSRRGLIADNFIEVADKIIDTGATSVFNVINNRGISGEALGSSSYVVDLTFAVGNVFTGNDVSATLPVIPAS